MLIALLLAGCRPHDPHDDDDRGESVETTVQVSAWPTSGTTSVWRTDLPLAGVATADGGAAVKWVGVEGGPGVALTAEGAFTLSVPLAWLLEHAGQGEDGTHPVHLELVAEASDGSTGSAELTVLVDPTPAQPVDTLELSLGFDPPEGAPDDGVPMSGAGVFTLGLCAEPSAAGATVALAGTGLTLTPASAVLGAGVEGCPGAGAMVVGAAGTGAGVGAGAEREVPLTASAGGLAWATAVPVYGAPWFGAATASQELGAVGRYDAASAAGLTECRAYGAPTQPVGVTAGDTAIQLVDPATGASHGWVDVGPVEALGLTVDASGTPDAGTITITCRDGWGQEGGTAITLVEPTP